jgi:hypothetical protein
VEQAPSQATGRDKIQARQQPIGDYIVDFVCFEKRIVLNSTADSTLIKSNKIN